ncbi:hypothetical protein U14_00403 [Candidatus Moduliflexus flocculans]|uniref:PIN domain-containing protein n=1 Tax=Candidatus Moduliflexus flocculans TaxID=1499966 RepID=A0A0S6VV89_9BACT|nr:hypothetical protein U14_00403 [Candidatus Moduliflexus flocculans]
MSDRIFIDTNVLIYLYSQEKEKQQIVLYPVNRIRTEMARRG